MGIDVSRCFSHVVDMLKLNLRPGFVYAQSVKSEDAVLLLLLLLFSYGTQRRKRSLYRMRTAKVQVSVRIREV